MGQSVPPVHMRTTFAALLATLLLWSNGLADRGRDDIGSLVVVVHVDNPKSNLTFEELASYFKMEQQWWPKPEKMPAMLILRGTRSEETQLLREKVYKMTDTQLRKYWVGKVFRGEIPREPALAVKTKDVLAKIAREPGAFSVMRADEVSEGVRPLTIDGKGPGDEGYLLEFEATVALR